ncbi:hypothetical protein NDU88_008253 [Pleurodeles waltl]|uniref:Uncharacterized protein n=1 Tax=Pleurodeles waltl TaxID=8319 RepID=A0AAV7VVY3_PLEWA|nr:hypothetical protein NDU88_008253 [Pleurodeles waltl]
MVPRRLSALAHARHLCLQAQRRCRPDVINPAPRDRLQPARAITCRPPRGSALPKVGPLYQYIIIDFFSPSF